MYNIRKSGQFRLIGAIFFFLLGATEMHTQEIFNCGFEPHPQFPGGEKKMMEYIRENFVYPEDALKQGIEGRVVLRFLVTQTGKIDSVLIQRSLFPSCDSVALRLVESMPDWIPGKRNGNPVGVYYTLPIKFDLQKYKEQEVDISDFRDFTTVTKEIIPMICYVETAPQFPGGEKALLEYIKKNLHYPNTDVCVVGRVILRFVVTPSGCIENIEVMRSLHPYFDKEAVEVVKSMPPWIPGKQNGKPVSVYYTLPVSFRLEN